MAHATLTTLAQAGMYLPQDEVGKAHAIPATLDNGYYSAAATQALEDLGFDPYMATGRQKHHAPEAVGERRACHGAGADGRESADA